MDVLLATGEQVTISLLAMALVDRGIPAVSMTGTQAGIRTTATHTRARIQSIDAAPLQRELDAGRVVVVAGFQGCDDDGTITTLGRGGSDSTAVAIAAALHAEDCEIYTDVDGVYTADPRRVPDARKLDRITFDEMLELSVLGAGVMHGRAVQFGQRFGVPIHVRHSRKSERGTLICSEEKDMEQPVVVGCALNENLGRISLLGLPNRPGVQSLLFGLLSKAEINIDDIIQNEISPTEMNISFTVAHDELTDVRPAMDQALRELKQGRLAIDVGLSKVSIVGQGMRNQAGVAAHMFKALADANINILNITTSEIKVSCIVNRLDGETGLRAVHEAFDLANEPGNRIAVVEKPGSKRNKLTV
jgi:aspartate kinase